MLRYAYRPRWSIIVMGIVFFGLGVAVLSHKASHNDRGLVLNGVIHFGVEGATNFYWGLVACSALFVLASVLLAWMRVARPQEVVLGEAALILPKGRWSREVQEIRYDQLRSLSTTRMNGQRFLQLSHSGGTATIAAGMLSSNGDFDEICARLAAEVEKLHRSPALDGLLDG